MSSLRASSLLTSLTLLFVVHLILHAEFWFSLSDDPFTVLQNWDCSIQPLCHLHFLLATLTRREREVLHELIHGQSSAEIAQRLCISRRTVETHRYNLTKKLGTKSIASLLRLTLQMNTPEKIT